MLSIALINSSAAAVAYFEKDDYYTKGEGEGAWYGKGAEALGLAGGVTREAFTDILEGRLPDGTNLGRMRNGELEHSPGWDLTFSAPKSVSIAAEVGGDERLFDAHDAAAKAAVDWVQANAAGNRTRGFFGTKEIRTDNLVVALFQHDTSREQDPQLHTHAVVANATLRDDGKWASLDSRDLFTFKMAAGNVYRAALAQEVQKLGYTIERTGTDGRFELSGVAPEVLEVFSTRRAQIEQAMKERGMEGAIASAQATLMTRANKENLPREDLAAMWSQKLGAQREDLQQLIAGARDAGDVRSAAPFRADRAVERAVDRLSEAEAVFTRAELIRWSLANAMGRGTVDQIEAAAALGTNAGHMEATKLGRLDAYTTPRARDQERRVQDAVRAGKNAVPRMVEPSLVRAFITGTTLNEGQREALEVIATSTDRYVGLVGRPGTGKSYLMGQTRELLESQGMKLLGMAQNSEAARKLQADSGILSGTLHRQLNRAFRDLQTMRSADPQAAAAIRDDYARQVWIVDEATQVGSRLARRMTTAAEKLGFRVVLIGDPKQLAAIDAGKPFELMIAAGMKTVELDEIRRQQNPEHLKAVRQVIKGDVDQALQTLAGDTIEEHDREARLGRILSAWRDLGDSRRDTFMLTAGNAEKIVLNDGAREILRGEGKLAGETRADQLGRIFSSGADRTEAVFYTRGDVVRFGVKVNSLQIERGEYLRIAGVDRGRRTVQLERLRPDGGTDRIEWDPRRVAGGGKRGVEVFRPRESSVAPGETIRWTRNTKEIAGEKISLNNGQLVTVTGVKTGALEVRTAEGETKTINTTVPEGRHWEHSYASTVYSAQGGTAKHVLVNAEGSKAELFNQKAFLVAISRQKETLTLFTDNNEHFQQNVEKRLGIKSSAIESRKESLADRVLGMLDRLEADWLRDRSQAPTPTPEREARDRGL
ncbi:MAG: conjugative relaxase domain protein [Nevskia sp.]|nr:conjugative relaxase domain protein [Nevskia sp.]